MMTNNPAYAALFEETANVLMDAQSRLEIVLERVQLEIQRSQSALDEKLERAARLPVGTHVFKDQNGDIRREDGSKVSDDLAATILWNGTEPTLEDVQADRQRLQRLGILADDIHAGQAEIGDMQAEINEDDDPLRNFVPASPHCSAPACDLDRGIKPLPKPRRTYPRSISRKETSLSFACHRSFQEDHRAIAPLGTHSLDLETCLSTNTEPCTNGCPFDHQSGERSCYPRYPHEDFIQTTSWRPTLRSLDTVTLSKVNHDLEAYRHP